MEFIIRRMPTFYGSFLCRFYLSIDILQNVGVAQAYLNQKRLDAEAKQLHTNATDFAKQTQNWLSLVRTFNDTLKDLGDVKNWAKSIEDDMRTVSSTLEYTYKVNREANSISGTSTNAEPTQLPSN